MTTPEVLQVALAVSAGVLAIYCMVLGRRLKRLNNLETGLGGAIAVMAAEVTRLQHAIDAARNEATAATQGLAASVESARQERALWAVQSRFGGVEAAPRTRLRRRTQPESTDA